MAARIYTRHGDDGTTGRFLGGRISKASPLVAACGDVDEAVAVLGIARAGCRAAGLTALAELVLRLQRELFVVGADLATHPERRHRLEPGVSVVTDDMTGALETLIDDRLAANPLQPVFLVPGTTAASAQLDLARTVVRRAERHAVGARDAGEHVSDPVLRYLNRISDLLFVLARDASGPEAEPVSH
ncbi:cob(I)yrinic acid a,c-diamide adenosyltransferase [Georgenia sp. H159]|uniref:cob(I)yrinic acid a,c-diamide adenosyltransferase n=1 Tax=Georgenia sp. H159 TaxID=3076115 RepID=UPI002D7A04C2|nr:cob(I)yrinic acid a,c-diamide adenosyltransferase [Georgenia sp. H159]